MTKQEWKKEEEAILDSMFPNSDDEEERDEEINDMIFDDD